MTINKKSKVFVAGHKGLVGSSIVKCLVKNGYKNIIKKDKLELDLSDQKSTRLFFEKEKPEVVICAAAKVGGIYANQKYPAQFLFENLSIQNNLIHFSHEIGVRQLLFLGSACIYPKNAGQPIRENSILSGLLEPTNEPYALAKIVGIKLCENYFRQYSDNFISVMPNNLYGPNDNFDPNTSHVIPALIQKFHNAKINSFESVQIWGSGKPLREFLHVDDLSEAVLYLMQNLSARELYEMDISHVNIGSGEEISIKDLALLIKRITNFKGKIYFDTTKPDGMPRKLLDSSFIHKLGWSSKISLTEGLKKLYTWFLLNKS